MNLEELKNAVREVRVGRKQVTWDAESAKEYNDALNLVLDTCESVLDVWAKMPERSNEPAFYCPMEILSHAEYKGRKEAIEQCALAITGALMSEKEGLKRFIDYGERLCNACIDADMQEDYEEVRYFKLELDKYKAQMEKLGDVR